MRECDIRGRAAAAGSNEKNNDWPLSCLSLPLFLSARRHNEYLLPSFLTRESRFSKYETSPLVAPNGTPTKSQHVTRDEGRKGKTREGEREGGGVQQAGGGAIRPLSSVSQSVSPGFSFTVELNEQNPIARKRL